MKKFMVCLVFAVLILGSLAYADSLQVLSLSQATFSSSHPFFNGKAWILTIAQGVNSQSIYGVINANDIGSRSGTTPANDLRIDITASTQSCEYKILKDDTARPLRKLQVIKSWWCWGLAPTDEEVNSNCGAGNWQFKGKYAQSFDCFCAGYTLNNAVGRFETPYVRTVNAISVSAKGESYTSTFDTKGVIQGFIPTSNPVVHVQWDGYLVRDVCLDKDPYYAYYDGRWYIGSQNYYNDYVSQSQAIENILIAQNGGTKEDIASRIATYNSYYDRAKTSIVFGQFSEGVNDPNSAIVQNVLKSQVSIPVYTLVVKADWLGIYQAFPKPEISEVAVDRFATSGQLRFKIKNIGTETGNINVYATCTSPVTVSGGSKTYTLSSGQSVIDYITLSADVKTATTSSCTVCGSVLDQKSCQTVTVYVDPEIICDANKFSCADNIVSKCNPTGSQWITLEACKPDEKCTFKDDGTSYCKAISGNECSTDKDCDDGKLETEDKCIKPLVGSSYCENKVQPFIVPLNIILPLLAGLIVFVYVLRKQGNGKKKRDILTYAMASLGAVITALLTYYVVSFIQSASIWDFLIFGVGGMAVLVLFGSNIFAFLGGLVGGRSRKK